MSDLVVYRHIDRSMLSVSTFECDHVIYSFLQCKKGDLRAPFIAWPSEVVDGLQFISIIYRTTSLHDKPNVIVARHIVFLLYTRHGRIDADPFRKTETSITCSVIPQRNFDVSTSPRT